MKRQVAMPFFIVWFFLGCREPELPLSRTTENSGLGVARAVIQILQQAHRGGSLVYSGDCDASSQREPYLLHVPPPTSSMDEALDQINQAYPNLTWIDYGNGGVRIFDKLLDTRLLNLRLKQFRIKNDETVELAVSTIWNAPEVRAFAAARHVTFVGDAPGIESASNKSSMISVELRDATIAEIMDKITQEYRPDKPKSHPNIWIYHDCEINGELTVDLEVM